MEKIKQARPRLPEAGSARRRPRFAPVWRGVCFAVALIVGSLVGAMAADIAADEAIARLKKGNARYLTGQHEAQNNAADREVQKSGQKPFAAVLTCSDSRVPPEILFDEGLGRLFVIRVAGNVIDPVTLGSVEYAAEHLHVPLILFLGHTQCGAVSAACAGGRHEGGIGEIVERIRPAVVRAGQVGPDEQARFRAAIENNVFLQMHRALRGSHILAEFAQSGKVKLAAGFYDIATGVVTILSDEATRLGLAAWANGADEVAHGQAGDAHAGAGTTDVARAHAPAPSPVHPEPAHAATGAPAAAEPAYSAALDRSVGRNCFTDGKNYCVQVAAYRSRESAEADVARLKSEGRRAFVTEARLGTTWYRVRLGPFLTLAEARAAAGRVNGHRK